MKVQWDETDDADDGSYDLCGDAHGKYVDVIGNGLNSASWSVSFNNVRLVENIASREEARRWIEKFPFSKVLDLVAEKARGH